MRRSKARRSSADVGTGRAAAALQGSARIPLTLEARIECGQFVADRIELRVTWKARAPAGAVPCLHLGEQAQAFRRCRGYFLL